MEGVRRRRNVLGTKSVVSFLGEREERVVEKCCGNRRRPVLTAQTGREWEWGESAFKEKMPELH